jgi:transposase
MSYQIKTDYTKTFLLPPSLEDWVSQDHPVRFIREFVENLNLKELGFKVETNQYGSPYYSSDLLLKVWVFGYYNKIRSTRELEKQAKENLSLIWLLGMETPDHNTIWRFWRDNKKIVKKIFVESVKVAYSLDLIGMVLEAVDGSKLRAYSSSREAKDKKQFTEILKTVEESVEKMEKEIEENKQSEKEDNKLPKELQKKKELKEKIKQAIEEIERTKRERLNANETEARIMKNEGKKILSYNGQAVVDSKNGIIVGIDVTNEENDEKQLIPMIEEAKQTIGKVAECIVADTGYGTAEQVGKAKEAGYDVIVSISEKSNLAKREDKKYHATNFEYDKERDVMICPEGKELEYEKTTQKKKNYKVRLYKGKECKECLMRDMCIAERKGKPRKENRVVQLNPYYEAINEQREKNKDTECIEKIKKRRHIVEPIFGIIKHVHNFRKFTSKGIENAKAQWTMLNLSVNMRKIYLKWREKTIKFA